MTKPYQTYENEKSEALFGAFWTTIACLFCTAMGTTELVDDQPWTAGIYFLAAVVWFAAVVVRLDTWRYWRLAEIANEEAWKEYEEGKK